MSSPAMSTVMARPVRAVSTGSAISSADRNWLETSPRTVTRSGALAASIAARADRERRKSFVAEISDVGAERAQRVDEIADRSLVHPRNAGQLVGAAGEREHGGQRPKRGAGVAEEQVRCATRE